MATTYTPTTELEAVNIMLGVIGESPVSSISVAGLSDVAIARQILHEKSREIQSMEWDFNSEETYPLTPDLDGYISVPTNCISLDVSNDYRQRYAPVIRGNRLYDKFNHTFIFPEQITADIIWFLPFEDCPETVRRYITIAAARTFQKRFYSSETLEGFTKEEEIQARALALANDSWTADYNMTANYSVMGILER